MKFVSSHPPYSAAGLIAGMLLCGAAQSALADRLVLRDFTNRTDVTVESFDPDGVKLSGGEIVPWSDIEKGTIDKARQESFDKQLAELGDPLYRIRRRLANGDYDGLLDHAEKLFPLYRGRNSETAYMVIQALMWGRMAAERREESVEPYLLCYQYLQEQGENAVSLPGSRRLRYDPTTGVPAELTPVWFDPEAAAKALPAVYDSIKNLRRRPEGAYLLYGTLALTAGKREEGLKFIGAMPGSQPTTAQLKAAALAQAEVLSHEPGEAVQSLAASVDRFGPLARPVALYWLGLAKTEQESPQQRREGVLLLLRLPGLYGQSHPELSAAALYRSMKTLAELDDVPGSVALRRELLDRYAQTVHAEIVRNESGG